MTVTGPDSLVTLQAIRLAGVADDEALLDRTLLGDGRIRAVIDPGVASGWIEWLSFADFGGWTLTGAGHHHLAGLLAQEVEVAGARAALAHALEDFEVINADFVERVGRWQLRSTGSGTTATSAEIDALLSELTAIGFGMRRVLTEVVSLLPRFGRYPFQFDTAVDRAAVEGLSWVTGVGMLSAHVVWAELHQDLLSTLGRSRDDVAAGQ